MFDLIVARPETEANIKGAADVCPPQPLVRPISPVDSNAVLIWRHCEHPVWQYRYNTGSISTWTTRPPARCSLYCARTRRL
jgi:hypothetical protein